MKLNRKERRMLLKKLGFDPGESGKYTTPEISIPGQAAEAAGLSSAEIEYIINEAIRRAVNDVIDPALDNIEKTTDPEF